MPRTSKLQREDIVNKAYEIVKEEGFSSINARRIAKELNCSIQPIFYNFATMEELNKAVTEKIYNKFKEIMDNSTDKEKPYLAKGMGYIKFAKEYPEFFKILFMRKSALSPHEFILADKVTKESVIQAGQSVFNLSYEEQSKLHTKIWLITHGLACLVATETIDYSENEIKELLGSSTREIIAGHKAIEGGNNE